MDTNTVSLALFKSVSLELTSFCNRNCPFCNRYHDRSGVYKNEDGSHVEDILPTEKAFDIFDQLEEMGYKGPITFSHYSEPFADKRLLSIAYEAKGRGMHPYINTNGDILRRDLGLCREAAQVFEAINVGIYDYRDPHDIEREKKEWKQRLGGGGKSYVRRIKWDVQ